MRSQQIVEGAKTLDLGFSFSLALASFLFQLGHHLLFFLGHCLLAFGDGLLDLHLLLLQDNLALLPKLFCQFLGPTLELDALLPELRLRSATPRLN